MEEDSVWQKHKKITKLSEPATGQAGMTRHGELASSFDVVCVCLSLKSRISILILKSFCGVEVAFIHGSGYLLSNFSFAWIVHTPYGYRMLLQQSILNTDFNRFLKIFYTDFKRFHTILKQL